MDYAWYLFRFEGRLNRANFWLAVPIVLCLMMVLAILAIIASKLFGGPESISFHIGDVFGVLDPESYRSLSAASLGQAVIKAIGTPLFLWIYLAVAIKRLHDRNKSAWWMMLFFVFPGLFDQFADRLGDSYAMMFVGLVSFVFCIWGFIELLFLKGTTGTNRFGADPLAPIDTRPPWDQQSEIEMVPHKAGPPPV
ncbi:DUF805 domain-containing protein [Bradyrhizobium sp. AUGA SZCCT0431]|uniref:DUF805 domain-containing protein n=1 Tax=Bradyrhizobium sp. AUGA SZCCT0431 TaxID=2807674 RepID=UPI001BA9BC6D|nr:DUF805 domain-containing protein [Bradyrhizobium sp. AUGA SZCCT0431]MBR1144921.1 DUF805 domain-containing protein [Bradyrhizobium sp. AUGA SZCCT0431]